ncbi:MAG TPA: hypothetical protein PLZ62_00660 [bacterium]|nr:hypothetical protein [bacterium]
MEIDIVCLDCGESIKELDKSIYEIGDIIECEACGAEHEIRSLEPVEVILIEEEK